MRSPGQLIFFLNRRCTLGCPSCNTAASPHNHQELTPQWLSAFFSKLGGLKFPGYIIWTGGEPFLSFDSLKFGIAAASARDYHSEILTSGAWFAGHPDWLEQLAPAGDFSLRISLDAEHQKKVPFGQVAALIKEAMKLKIGVNFTLREIPGCLETRGYYLEQIRRFLPDFYQHNRSRSRWIHVIPHIPVSPGNLEAAVYPTASRQQKWQKSCAQGFKDLVIGADGLVYPCCGLFRLPCYYQLAVGDLLAETWESLWRKQSADPLFQVLQKKGPFGICQELDLDPGTWCWPPFQIPCQLCLPLFLFHAAQIFRHYRSLG